MRVDENRGYASGPPRASLDIREERPGDEPAIREINQEAFETDEESVIVDRLRETCPDQLSLVAIREGELVGHILFTPVTARRDGGTIIGMGLAPMAVRPRLQRQGIGSKLVRSGLMMIREDGYPFVVVLGHPEYYPRFGFERASDHGLSCEYDGVPDEAFMVQIFDAGAINSVSGLVKYRPEFSSTL